jgi:urease accessory protein
LQQHLAALLALADGRFPSGGYAHSGGLEQAIRQGWVANIDDLSDFLRGRAHTTGLMNAAFAAACHPQAQAMLADTPSADHEHSAPPTSVLHTLDAELRARTPSPELRQLGQWLGKLMLRSVQKIYPDHGIEEIPENLQQPLVYGSITHILGLDQRAAAAVVLHEAVTGPATAAVKLMSIDPYQAHGSIVRLAPELDRVALAAVEYANTLPIQDLPALSSPLSDFAAELHSEDHVRLFAS